MLYRFLRFLARLALGGWYRQIRYSGIEHLKSDRPTLIACNHPSGFTEPIVLGCLFDLPVHFLVRGDMFEKKWLRWLLISTNQIPIFRFRDGFKGLRDNHKHMQYVREKLRQGERIIIFIEGSTNLSHRLRPLQKGLARIAKDTLQENPELLIDVLPVGINFIDSNRLRSDVLVGIGEPITLDAQFLEGNHKENMKELTENIAVHMRKHIIHLDDIESESILKKELIPVENEYNDPSWGLWKEDRVMLDKSIKIADRINKGEQSVERKLSLGSLHYVKSFLLFPFFIIGVIVYGIPLMIIKLFIDKKVKKPVFYSSLGIGFGVFVGLLYFIILCIVALYFGKLHFLILLLPIWMLSLWFSDLWMKNRLIKTYQEL